MEAIFFVFLIIVVLALFIWNNNRTLDKQRRLEREREATEAKRLADCEQVVRYFANFHGYVARSAVSRDELSERINAGATANELAEFIAHRITEVPGPTLGYQSIGETRIPVILPERFRDKHVYVIGKSGYGKTNFLRYLIMQDLNAGHGVGVLAPEFEMLQEELLPFIPEHRIDDVVYFNPADLHCPVVFNPLHLDPDEDIDLRVDETFTIFQRVVREGGPRMDEILRHALYALIERAGSTLLDIELLLDRHDDQLRRAVIRDTTDERTRRFFSTTYPQMPKDAHLPILNRLGRFVRAKYVRNCLCPPVNTSLNSDEIGNRLLNIRDGMDEGKILLFNLSDGLLGEAASQLIGQLIVSKFQTAIMSRANIPKTSRRPFYLYLDEFQNFCGHASQSYERILSRARKYGLGLVLAHQQTGQVPLELIREIFGNVTTMVSFQVSQADAARISREFIAPYDFKLDTVPPEELLQLKVGHTYCRIGGSSFPMTVPLVDLPPNREIAETVVNRSRERYGIPRQSTQARPGGRIAGEEDDALSDLDPGSVF